MGIFTKSSKGIGVSRVPGFSYLPASTYYFDSACQTLRPDAVIAAEDEYYRTYNACGGRVKYPWGVKVDTAVRTVRSDLLRFVGKSEKEYAVAFTLNTTYGINVVLHQIPAQEYSGIVTSDIEHNSVFLPTMTWSQRNAKKRLVLPRADDGALLYKAQDLSRAIVLLNTASNIDGRTLVNAREIAEDVHAKGGLLLLDAAQTFGHHPEALAKVDFDAAFGSAHKMYGPSLGFVIIKKDLLRRLEISFIGGGTVQDVDCDTFTLIQDPQELYSRIEPGLQNWAGIIGLGAAIGFMREKCGDEAREQALSESMFQGLKSIARVKLINRRATPVMSFHVDNLDAHRLALYLGEQQIMCRSGYFCCHYYLDHLKKLPPLLRVSIGRNNTEEQVEHFLSTLKTILQNF